MNTAIDLEKFPPLHVTVEFWDREDLETVITPEYVDEQGVVIYPLPLPGNPRGFKTAHFNLIPGQSGIQMQFEEPIGG